MNLDHNRVAEVAMALLSLTMFKDGPVHRAWKGMDWNVLEDLFERGWIRDPKGKAKSVVFTDEGRRKALDFQVRHLQEVVQQADAADSPSDRR